MHGFRKLQVYTTARELVKEVYTLLENLPSTEKFALSDQLRRAVISVPSNIAEGLGRSTNKDKGHFMQIAYGSLMEVLAQLDVANYIGFISDEQLKWLKKEDILLHVHVLII